VSLKIQPDQIGAVIGPGGKVIRGIQELSGTKIDIEDDGTVYISGVGSEATDMAIDEIKKLTYVPQVGDRLSGPVKTIIAVGAFVEIAPGKDAFVHVSQLAPERVERVEDVVAVGDVLDVVITDVRADGKIDASRRAAITGEMPPPRPPRGDRGPRFDRERRGEPAMHGAGRPGGPPRRDDGRPRDGRRPGYNRRDDA
jgi:polyribonucleotide nucleotidyltransferase